MFLLISIKNELIAIACNLTLAILDKAVSGILFEHKALQLQAEFWETASYAYEDLASGYQEDEIFWLNEAHYWHDQVPDHETCFVDEYDGYNERYLEDPQNFYFGNQE